MPTRPRTQPAAPKARRLGIAGVHAEIRRRVITGELEPNATLAQPRLAKELNVGRTQLREALRLLQQEGLLVAEHNRGMRVAEIDVERVDTVYASRIVLEAVGALASVPNLSHADLDFLATTSHEMRIERRKADLELWSRHHAVFHKMVYGKASPSLVTEIVRYADMAERYWRRYQQVGVPRELWKIAEQEHEEILRACQRGDGLDAARSLARHLARTALSLSTELDPSYSRFAVRAALRLVLGNAKVAPLAPSAPSRPRAAKKLPLAKLRRRRG